MPTFEIESFTSVKCNSASFRSELHGKELVPAVDLSFTGDFPNSILSCFDGALLGSLYFRGAATEAQGEIDGVEQILPNLRFAKMGLPIKWDASVQGATLVIDYGMGGDNNIELDLCKVNNFQITPKEGGTVELKWRVQCASDRLTETIRGKLTGLIQHDVDITLTAAEPMDSDDDEDDINPLPFDADPDAQPANPFTPEQALIDSVGDQA